MLLLLLSVIDMLLCLWCCNIVVSYLVKVSKWSAHTNSCSMYGGVDKDGGGIVGADPCVGTSRGADIFQVAETAAAEEVLVCYVSTPLARCKKRPFDEFIQDEEGQKVLMHAHINHARGGLEWSPITADDSAKVVARSVAMNQMASMLHDRDRCSSVALFAC